MVNMDPYDVFSSQFIQRIIFPASPWKWASAEAPGRIVAARMEAGFFFGRIKISSICPSILFFHLDPHDVETQNCLFRPRTIRLTWKIAQQCIQFHFPAKMPGFWDTFWRRGWDPGISPTFSPELFHYYATSSSLNEKSFERNQQLRIKYQVLSNHLQYSQLSGQVFMPMTKATSLTWWRHILLTPCLPPGGFLFIKLNYIILFSYC